MTKTGEPTSQPLHHRVVHHRVVHRRVTRTATPDARTPRVLHLLDVENLTAGQVTAQTLTRMWSAYTERVGVGREDHVVVAVADRNALTTWYTLPAGIRRVVAGSGPDAADRALVESLDIPHTADRFTHLVIGSADHYFAALARTARQSGLDVVQVLRDGAYTSARLHRECSRQVRLT